MAESGGLKPLGIFSPFSFYKVLYFNKIKVEMKAITEKEKLPKFLMVIDGIEKKPWNRFLIKPYSNGEVVKVAPFEEQVPHPSVNTTPEKFRNRYVVVYRKDAEGKWTLKYTEGWEVFDLLKKKIA